MLSIGIGIGVIILLGALFLWGLNNLTRSLLFILLMLSTIFLGYMNIGTPRSSYIWGIPSGYLLSFYTNVNKDSIAMWIQSSNGDNSLPISVRIPYSDKEYNRLQKAKQIAGQNGSVRIKGTPNLLLRLLFGHKTEKPKKAGKGGNNASTSMPFTVPFMLYPQPWIGGTPKSPPTTYSGQ